MRFASVFRRREERSTGRSSDPYLAEFFGQRGSASVDTDRASRYAIAIAARNVIAQGLAHLPLKLYRWTDNGGREPAREHPLYEVLQVQMNSSLTAFLGREMLIQAVATYGNGYARIERNGRGQVTALYPLDPREVAVERLSSGRLRYRAGGEVILQEDMLHVRYTSRDGVMGLSPIQEARETFALALSHTDEAIAISVNAFRPAGVFSFDANLSDRGRADIFEKFKSRLVGAMKANDPIVLDGGGKFTPITQTSKDAEFLESRKLSNMDVCRIYGVPPSTVGITDNATYSNIGEESRALVVRCLAPWAKRIEQAMNVALLTPESRKTFFIEHDLAGLLRGDLKARYEAYRIGREWGWLNGNEIRGMENLPTYEGGDRYLTPLNMDDGTGGGDE